MCTGSMQQNRRHTYLRCVIFVVVVICCVRGVGEEAAGVAEQDTGSAQTEAGGALHGYAQGMESRVCTKHCTGSMATIKGPVLGAVVFEMVLHSIEN